MAGAQKGQGGGEERKDGPNGCTGLAVEGSLAQVGTAGRTQFQSWLAGFIRGVFLPKLRCPSHSQKGKDSRAQRRAVRQPRPDKDDSSKRPGPRAARDAGELGVRPALSLRVRERKPG